MPSSDVGWIASEPQIQILLLDADATSNSVTGPVIPYRIIRKGMTAARLYRTITNGSRYEYCICKKARRA
jgi:hypothetical protein